MERRKSLCLTQKHLSELSDVAQSVISRIEQRHIFDPSFNTMKNLFEAMDRFELHNLMIRSGKNISGLLVAKDLVNAKVVSVKPDQTANEAWAIMKEWNFSQLPVIDDKGKILGGITEITLLPSDLDQRIYLQQDILVKEIMDDTFAIVSKNMRLASLAAILRREPAVLVTDRGKIIGIITKSDLIERTYGTEPDAFR